MKPNLVIIAFAFLGCNLASQKRIENFPEKKSFLSADFAKADNIFPIAFLNVKIDNKDYKIPVSYSFLCYKNNDSSNFFSKSDNIDNYSLEILDDGKCKPLFKKETLNIPADWAVYFESAKRQYDSVKLSTKLERYFKFLNEPEWWQYDATPKGEDGKPLKFICQIELHDIVGDDCALYIFFDEKKKIVRQIFQRD